jgi:phosphoribosylaminoimidazolecarboxamide formyltransferase / IMP cyclohydrolase
VTRRMLGTLLSGPTDDRWLRHHPKVLAFEFASSAKRPDKANAIDLYVSGNIPDTKVEKEQYEATFKSIPEPLSEHERIEFMQKLNNVTCSSDAFFPFPDNIHRLAKVVPLIILISVWRKVCRRPRRKCPGYHRARYCR